MEHKVKFNGNASEYFGIWIVNIFLTIVTFGIYSAWAKVRTKRYFYGNTSIDGHAFDYHAKGEQILIGRIIVVVALAVYQVLAALNLIAAGVLLLIYIGFVPYLIVQGLRFSQRMTSYRNVRFDFKGTYWQAFFAIILMPIVNVFAFYLVTPYVSQVIGQFVANNSRYGDRPFELSMPVGPLYKVLAIFVTTLLLLILAQIAVLYSSGISANSEISTADKNKFVIIIFLIMVPTALIAISGVVIYSAVVRNITFNNLLLDNKHHFSSTVSPMRYVFIVFTNTIVVLLTLGLMSPWAKIRIARYLAGETSVTVQGSLEKYASSVQSSTGVVGSEFMDIEGVDVGFGA